MIRQAGSPPAPVKMAVLQQIHLCIFRDRLCETDADTDQAHRFPGARECLGQKRVESFQRWRKSRALGSSSREIVELQFHEYLCDLTRRFLLRQISHHILKEFFEFFFALFERGEIDSEGFLRAQRFARTIGFDWPIIDAAAKVVELKAKFAEYINKFRPRESLEFATGFDAEFFEFSFALLADSPDLAHGQVFHEIRDLFRAHFELAIRLVNFARDFRDELVWSNPRGRREFGRAKNCAADFLR